MAGEGLLVLEADEPSAGEADEQDLRKRPGWNVHRFGGVSGSAVRAGAVVRAGGAGAVRGSCAGASFSSASTSSVSGTSAHELDDCLLLSTSAPGGCAHPPLLSGELPGVGDGGGCVQAVTQVPAVPLCAGQAAKRGGACAGHLGAGGSPAHMVVANAFPGSHHSERTLSA